MPPLPRLKIPPLATFAHGLRLTPAKAALRQLENVEALIPTIEPEGRYPVEFVLFRVTGYRVDLGPGGDLVVDGPPLVEDLTALAEHLSLAAELVPADHAPPRWTTADDLCARWGISRKTLDRYRRRGLPARRVPVEGVRAKGGKAAAGPGGSGGVVQRLVFDTAAAETFRERHAGALGGAAAFRRADDAELARVLRRAARYARLGLSLNAAAERIAARSGRSAEGVRRMLIRHDERAPTPAERLFDRPAQLRAGARTDAARAVERGESASDLARRLGKRRGSVYRAAGVERADRLRSLDLHGPRAPWFDTDTKSEAALADPAVNTGLGGPGPRTLAEFLAAAGGDGAHAGTAAVELARSGAYLLLRHRAAVVVAAIDRHHPRAAMLDEAETLLRWASRLKAELVRSQLGALLRGVESRLGRSLATLPPGAARAIVTLGLDALIEATDRFDPFRGGRLAAPVGIAVNRAAAAWAQADGALYLAGKPGAAARASAAVTLDDFTRRVNPWQAWLELAPAVEGTIAESPDAGGEHAAGTELIRRRYGLDGRPPWTAARCAADRGVTASQVTRIEHAFLRRFASDLTGERPNVAADVAVPAPAQRGTA